MARAEDWGGKRALDGTSRTEDCADYYAGAFAARVVFAEHRTEDCADYYG